MLYCERKISEFGDAEFEIQGKLYCERKISDFGDLELEIQAGTMKRVAVQENAHILVIGFSNSNYFISNQRLLGKLF